MSTHREAEAGTEGGRQDLKRVMGPGLLLLCIVGDILGAGVYAVTGKIAGEVGGVAWLPFVVAFAVATLTAFSYLELVTKYPKAAGAALYAHKAFGIHFVTFLVAFTVVCSGITSASTSSALLASNLLIGLDEINGAVPTGSTASLVVALLFMCLLAAINLRGVAESVKFNVVLTLIEMSALAIVIGIGFWAMSKGDGDLARAVVFDSGSDRGMFAAVTVATAVAFFSMVGFEDSVNMVEETKEPERIFPRTMLTGLGIAVVIYMLVAVSVVAVIPAGDIANPQNPEAGVLLDVVRVGAPGLAIDRIFPFLTVFAVANTALINMLMASRLIYGMAAQDVLPRALSRVLPGRRSPWTAIVFTTALALGLIVLVSTRSDSTVVGALGHHRPVAAGGVRGRQRGLPGAASRPSLRGLPRPDRDPGRRRGRLRVPGGALGPRPGRLRAVPDRGLAAGPGHRAVGAHLGDQPGAAVAAHRLPRHRPPGGVSPRRGP